MTHNNYSGDMLIAVVQENCTPRTGQVSLTGAIVDFTLHCNINAFLFSTIYLPFSLKTTLMVEGEFTFNVGCINLSIYNL